MKSFYIFCSLLLCLLLRASAVSGAGEQSNSDAQQAAREASRRAAYKNRSPLQSTPLYFLPLTSIRPKGWLERQLRIQADGLSGHLDEVWSDVGPNSAWLGGTGEAWERGPLGVM